MVDATFTIRGENFNNLIVICGTVLLGIAMFVTFVVCRRRVIPTRGRCYFSLRNTDNNGNIREELREPEEIELKHIKSGLDVKTT